MAGGINKNRDSMKIGGKKFVLIPLWIYEFIFQPDLLLFCLHASKFIMANDESKAPEAETKTVQS